MGDGLGAAETGLRSGASFGATARRPIRCVNTFRSSGPADGTGGGAVRSRRCGRVAQSLARSCGHVRFERDAGQAAAQILVQNR